MFFEQVSVTDLLGLSSHSGTGEERADDENGMTSADAQAFKRACTCFGLGRYFYEFQGSWVDLDQNQQPKHIPALPAWAIPDNWRKGIRPPGKNCNGNGFHANRANGNGDNGPKPNERQASASAKSGADDLATRILAMKKAVGLTHAWVRAQVFDPIFGKPALDFGQSVTVFLGMLILLTPCPLTRSVA